MDHKLKYSSVIPHHIWYSVSSMTWRWQGLQGFLVMIDLQGILLSNRRSGKNQRIVDKL